MMTDKKVGFVEKAYQQVEKELREGRRRKRQPGRILFWGFWSAAFFVAFVLALFGKLPLPF
jgi:hypothetical protein